MQEDSRVQTIIDESETLRLCGKQLSGLTKVKTVAKLGLSPTPQQKRSIASVKFAILLEQGYYKRAETVLRKALAVSSEELSTRKSEEELWMHALLRAKRAYVMLYTTGRDAYVYREWTELNEMFQCNIEAESGTNTILVFPILFSQV